jgi:sterol 3beta-glucosyltransferase
MDKPVILLTSGTRGDVQPYIALGLGLQAAGIPVRLASDPQFAALAGAYHLPFIPIEGNPSQLLMQPGRQNALRTESGLSDSLRASLAYVSAAQPLFARMIENAWLACQDAAALVIGLPSLWGAHIAEALNIPCIYGLLQPLTRTASHPSVLMPPGLLPTGALFNRISHRLIEQMTWQPWRAQINRWRRSSLRLPPAPLAGIIDRQYAQNAQVLYAFSTQVVPPPPDWPAHHYLTGFWFLEAPPAWQPSADLQRFLANGDAPVYLGFGSPGPLKQGDWIETARLAAGRNAMHMVLSLAPGDTGRISADEAIFGLTDVPHDWLFPRCSLLVHHGGAGTTAAGLRAGVPTLVLPRATDQFYWGSRIYALGCGPHPLPQSSLSPMRLVDALRHTLQHPAYRENAARLGSLLRAENGVEQAVRHIAAWLG